MKTFSLAFIALFSLACTSVADPSNSPSQNQPSTQAPSKGFFKAICKLTFDADGHRTMAMSKSTGSKALDDYFMQHQNGLWNGLRNRSLSIGVTCQAVAVSTPHGKKVVEVMALHPPYPYQARALHEQGSGNVRASFDEKGNITNAAMAQSTGSQRLDGNTVFYAQKFWRSSGGEKVTTIIPVTYRLR